MREAVMKTFYGRSEADPDLHGFTDEVSGSKLPSENRPWTFIRQLASEGEWPSGISKAVTAAGVLENGFSLSNYRAAKPIIASDRVEGTAVYDPSGSRIGTIRRFVIEKVSVKVLYADIAFGGFLGLGWVLRRGLALLSFLSRVIVGTSRSLGAGGRLGRGQRSGRAR